jgi:hypothetical protein
MSEERAPLGVLGMAHIMAYRSTITPSISDATAGYRGAVDVRARRYGRRFVYSCRTVDGAARTSMRYKIGSSSRDHTPYSHHRVDATRSGHEQSASIGDGMRSFPPLGRGDCAQPGGCGGGTERAGLRARGGVWHGGCSP